jgi:hypothetical protein
MPPSSQFLATPLISSLRLDRYMTKFGWCDLLGKVTTKAVTACCRDRAPKHGNKSSTKCTYRRKSPTQHELFLQYAVRVDFDCSHSSCDTQSAFDLFYIQAIGLLDTFYPERVITITSWDPAFVTADIKAKLRRKNRLMRAGRVEEADALARLIGKEMKSSVYQASAA